MHQEVMFAPADLSGTAKAVDRLLQKEKDLLLASVKVFPETIPATDKSKRPQCPRLRSE